MCCSCRGWCPAADPASGPPPKRGQGLLGTDRHRDGDGTSGGRQPREEPSPAPGCWAPPPSPFQPPLGWEGSRGASGTAPQQPRGTGRPRVALSAPRGSHPRRRSPWSSGVYGPSNTPSVSHSSLGSLPGNWKDWTKREVPRSPVASTLHVHFWGPGFNPWLGSPGLREEGPL